MAVEESRAVVASPPEEGVAEQTLRISGMTCAACQRHVEEALERVPGVTSAEVNLLAHTARVQGAGARQPETLMAAVRSAGYDAWLPGDAAANTAKGTSEEGRRESSEGRLGFRALLSLVAGVVAMGLSMPVAMSSSAGMTGDPLERFLQALLTPVMPE